VLFILGFTVGTGYLFIQQQRTSDFILPLGLIWGLYNSARLRLMFGLLAALHMPWYCLYRVTNIVYRDYQSGVEQNG
jgi:hypothetical protein